MALFFLTLLNAFVPAGAHVIARSTAERPPAPAPQQQQPSLEAYHVTFEIKNLNYYDLTQELCPEKPKTLNAPSGNGQGKHSQAEGGGMNPLTDMDHALENVFDHAEDIVEKSAAAVEKSSAELEKEVTGHHHHGNLLQVPECSHENYGVSAMKIKECTTVMVILRDAITKTVRDVVNCALHEGHVAAIVAGGPTPAIMNPEEIHSLAPSPARVVPLPPQGQQSFLQIRDLALAPAPVAAALKTQARIPDVGIFVTFTPGTKLENGATVMVDVAFLDKPNNLMHDVLSMIPAMNHCINTGQLHMAVREAIESITGLEILLGRLKANTQKIKQWPIDQCETHIQEIVQNFTIEYTREQVPRAMYNECTNFFTKFSFSHDYVLDPMDAEQCKRATVKFTKKWELGKNSEATDFKEMCMYACEAKYGKDAPTCHIAEGDNMLKQHA